MKFMRSLPDPLLIVLLVLGSFTGVATAQVTASFQDGVNGYNGTRDTKLIADSPTTNYGVADEMELDGSPDASSVLSWDLTSIPVGSTIQAVDITVNVTNTSSDDYEIYQMLRPWIESQATWNVYASGQNWQVGGANGSADRASTVLGSLTASSRGALTVSLGAAGVAMVQSWVNDPASNHGLIILDYDNASNGLDFSSSEEPAISDRPKLTVTYGPGGGGGSPALSINDVSVTEGNSGTVNATFNVSLSYTGAQTVTVNYATANGSATAGTDYFSGNGLLTFSPGVTSRTFTVSVIGDTNEESNETFFVNLSNAVNATIWDAQGTGTIVNDDYSSAGEPITFSVTGDFPYSSSEVADFQRVVDDHNRYSPSDLFFHVGDIVGSSESCQEGRYQDVADVMKALNVPAFIVIGDNEWTDCSNPSQGWQWWTANFTDFEQNFCQPPAVDHQNVRHENWAFVSKGVLFLGINIPNGSLSSSEEDDRLQDNADWVDFHFQDKVDQVRAAVVIGHSGPSSSRSLFFDQFEASSVVFGKPVFYIMGDDHNWKLDNPWSAPNMQRLTVEKGASEDPPQITVTMNPDNPFEIVRDPWSNNPPVLNRDPCGDPGQPMISINDASVVEGDGGQVDAVFSVTLSSTSQQTVSVNYTTANGSATTGNNDYDSISGTLTFNPGVTSRSIAVKVNGDQTEEADENFFVNLSSASNASIADGQGEGTIFNDDQAPTLPTLSVNDVSVTEGDGGTVNADFTVTLSGASQQTVTVQYATANGSATTGNNDYNPVSGTLNFAPSVTNQTISVQVNGDTASEADENFFVNLSNASNATIADGQGEGTITNDDQAPTLPALSIDDVSADEGAGSITFTVSLSAVSSQEVRVNFATNDDTAIAPGDYTAASGTLTIPQGTASGTISVTVIDDVSIENSETFTVDLSNPVNATIADNQGVGTITNNDSGGGGETVTVSFQQGVNGYNGARDTKLAAESPSTNYGSASELELDGKPELAALMYWDITNIPSGSTVESVDITIEVTNSSGHTYEIYESLRSWVGNQATWNQYASGLGWQVAGASGSSDRGSTELGVITGEKGYITIPLNASGVAVVQSWVANASSNRGFVIQDYDNASNGLDFSSNEEGNAANRPKLTVTYTAPAQAGNTVASRARMEGPQLAMETLPEKMSLSPNYPNPFNLETRIDYALPESGTVRLMVYNITGQLVRTLVAEDRPAGYNSALWDGRDDFGRELGSGVYLAQLVVGQQRFTRMMVLQK